MNECLLIILLVLAAGIGISFYELAALIVFFGSSAHKWYVTLGAAMAIGALICAIF